LPSYNDLRIIAVAFKTYIMIQLQRN